MRAVGLSDLDVAVRALLVLEPADRPRAAREMIEAAHAADLWRKRFGVAHPNGGTGSLYAQAALRDRFASSSCTPDYCAALVVLVDVLAAWRGRGNRNL